MGILKLKRPTFIHAIKSTILTTLLKNKHKKNSITLTHNTIYVLPSTLGVYFTIVALLNFVMGINYQNNLNTRIILFRMNNERNVGYNVSGDFTLRFNRIELVIHSMII